ncbi:MAG: type II toxin-antitoxin system HicB family antitoxin [Candidatus Marinimicrobia bacterium]|nr:type II toxin-antitoxin system HicB family antitoxin [Candidatus Neomarinimicrobiota bacterium]
MEIKIVLDEQDEGGFTVYVPSLPGCVSQGDSVDQALRNIKEAIELHLETEVSSISPEGRIMNIEI